ncbi:MAG: type I-E CRISPR-associated protein Cse1/CasA [Peptoniphilus sp.]|nr:type I-E CRISPR-associated protein Cse1/CasA [Peptoniphilus sp.]MDD7363426.1 type I-E CRISPR-associated protein Cse1/CasA [Bacillota bacterium]MDY6044428.1 type I-E CRISPR-associated protein Cse1/CasA [Peptoniphilus sp.]
MGRFNLLDEPWIRVVASDDGRCEEVSLKDVFENAHTYKGLGGEMKAQDFAVFRLLLAVLHTVFSRVDSAGEIYGCDDVDGSVHTYFKLDERMRPLAEVEEDDVDDYAGSLYDTWESLWNRGSFPPCMNEYLERWRDRFFLFDETYPFFQVREADIGEGKINKSSGSSIAGKNINRRISESGNKKALFSPRTDKNDNKSFLTEAELARWLVTYQGYCGLSDKVIFGKEKYEAKVSKGWLFDLGGLCIKGKTLFESLLLNLALVRPDQPEALYAQKPCWEYSPQEMIERYLRDRNTPRRIDNLAELYTLWSRAIYIDPETDMSKPFAFEVVKLPDVAHVDHFIEPMTLWRFNKQGDNKDRYTPRKHREEQSLWRSFGLISGKGENEREPGVIQWITDESISPCIQGRRYRLVAVTMKDDGNATSWVPVNEITDTLRLHEKLLTDEGWEKRVNDVVDMTNRVVQNIYGRFMYEVKDIRNVKQDGFVEREIAQLYYAVDEPFRQWIARIQPSEDKESTIDTWKKTLKKIVKDQADHFVAQAGPRDFIGRVCSKESGDNKEGEGEYKNIATAYNAFSYFLNKQLDVEEG